MKVSNTLKITFVAALIIILGLGIYLSFVVLGEKRESLVTKTTTTTTTKSVNEKDLEEIQKDIQISDDLELDGIEVLEKELSQIEKELNSISL